MTIQMKYIQLVGLFAIFLFSCKTKNTDNLQSGLSPEIEKLANNIPSLKTDTQNKVMVLGVFHFDRSMDGSDVVAKNHLDITSNQNQAILDSLISILAEFHPTKIVVEWQPQWQGYIDSLYALYRQDAYTLGKNETFQLGFKLAKKLGHEKIFCVDTNPPMPETVNSIDDWDQYAADLGQTELWHKYDAQNEQYLTYLDTLQNSLNVLDYLQLINSSKNMERTKQLWTTGIVDVGHGDKYLGADLLGRWYRRNVRIFVNSKNLVSKPNENLLIIYGNAHKWILDELFDSSPEFEVTQLNDLLQEKNN